MSPNNTTENVITATDGELAADISKYISAESLNALVRLAKQAKQKMHQVNFNKGQTKNRKNARRRFAAGDKRAFDK